MYEIVAKEIESGLIHDGVWAKAYAQADGDEKKAMAAYIKLRVTQLPEEIKAYLDVLARQRNPLVEYILRIAKKPIQDMDHVPSDRFDGDPSLLKQPILVEDLSADSGLLVFQIIDLIKGGKLKGVRFGEDWYVEGSYYIEP